MYKVSICTPIYGVEKYIERCARSLFEQTYHNIEFVFVDDCSPDKSVEILKNVLSEYPARTTQVRIIKHERNRGLAGARNTGIESATGEFILWVDSDDSIDITTVDKLVAVQESINADIVCFDAKVKFRNCITYYRNDDYVDSKDLTLRMLSGDAPHQIWGHLIRKSLYLHNNIRAIEGINQAEDYQVMPRLAYYADKIGVLHEALYLYDRTTENSYSNNFSVRYCEQAWKALDYINSFFADKGDCYIDAIFSCMVSDISLQLKDLSLLSDGDDMYNSLLARLDEIPKHKWPNLPVHRKIVLVLRKKTIVKIYSLILSKIKQAKK